MSEEKYIFHLISQSAERYRQKIPCVKGKDHAVLVTSGSADFLEHLHPVLEPVEGHQGRQLYLVVARLVNGHLGCASRRVRLNMG